MKGGCFRPESEFAVDSGGFLTRTWRLKVKSQTQSISLQPNANAYFQIAIICNYFRTLYSNNDDHFKTFFLHLIKYALPTTVA